MKPVTILKRARKLIEKPEHWAQGHFVNDVNGVTAYCADGACMKAAGNFVLSNDYWAAYEYLARSIKAKRLSVWAFNDAPTRKHSQVLAAFDRAIALAEKGAQS